MKLFNAIAVSIAVMFSFNVTLKAQEAGLEKVRSYSKAKLETYLGSMPSLLNLLMESNKERSQWQDYSKDWKKWDKKTAKGFKNRSYTWGEYQWSIAKKRKFKKKHFKSDAAKELKQFQESSNGAIAEIFVTDAKGGNVAQTQETSDWFQGDEKKFKAVAQKKESYIAPFEVDESTGLKGSQVSIPLYKDGQFAGVAVVLVILEKIDLHK